MIAVVGMAFEARIAARLGVPVVCGGDGRHLERSLARAMAAGCKGLISFGVAGGLAPELKPGHLHHRIERHRRRRRAPDRRALVAAPAAHHSRHGLRTACSACTEPIAFADDKCALASRRPARSRVDMESHVVARAAARHGVPLAVDPRGGRSGRSAPFRARRSPATRPDGTIDPLAVVRSLMRYPRDLIGLIRMSLDARAARATLVQGQCAARPGTRAARFRAACPRLRLRSKPHRPTPHSGSRHSNKKARRTGRAFRFRVGTAALIPPPSDAPARARPRLRGSILRGLLGRLLRLLGVELRQRLLHLLREHVLRGPLVRERDFRRHRTRRSSRRTARS